jgi:hypothetical protein
MNSLWDPSEPHHFRGDAVNREQPVDSHLYSTKLDVSFNQAGVFNSEVVQSMRRVWMFCSWRIRMPPTRATAEWTDLLTLMPGSGLEVVDLHISGEQFVVMRQAYDAQ